MTSQPRHMRWTDRLPKSLGAVAAIVLSLATIGSAIVWITKIDNMITATIEAKACSPSKVDTIVHAHIDPILDSFAVLNRKILKQNIYQTVQIDVMMGPEKAALAEKKYLAIIKAMEGRR